MGSDQGSDLIDVANGDGGEVDVAEGRRRRVHRRHHRRLVELDTLHPDSVFRIAFPLRREARENDRLIWRPLACIKTTTTATATEVSTIRSLSSVWILQSLPLSFKLPNITRWSVGLSVHPRVSQCKEHSEFLNKQPVHFAQVTLENLIFFRPTSQKSFQCELLL